jgi:hypothetical protein
VVSPLSKPGPTLGEVKEDGNLVTPNTSGTTTSPKKKVFTQLADTFTGFFSPKEPASSTPSSTPDDSAPSGSPPQGQTSNAA